MIIIIDMVYGFTDEGLMASPLVKALIKPIASLVEQALTNDIKVIHYTDSHPKDAQEFNTYPLHCIENTKEAQPVAELNNPKIMIIKKNSTNGFLAFNPFIYGKNLFICGCITDVCIYEFALTAQKYKEQYNLPYTVNIYKELVQTFDSPKHHYQEINDCYLKSLQNNGINII
ncbi:MAG: cysteine hydrolase [Bacilli bacterium]|jgi:nicotinamidase-related amidase|nr:cysteine hydrolase [Bacilli bacterium]